jgi:hypothetical protein
MNSREDIVANCPRCKAIFKGGPGYCWKCGVWIDIDDKGIASTASDRDDASLPEHAGFSYSISSLLLVTTLIAVCLALAAAAPGLGILLAVVSIPPFVRTILLVRRRKQQGKNVSAGAKVSLYLGSFGVTLVVTCVTLFMSLSAFFFSCLGAYSLSRGQGMRSGSEEFSMTIATVFSLAIAGLLIWSFSHWIRSRWRRDFKL